MKILKIIAINFLGSLAFCSAPALANKEDSDDVALERSGSTATAKIQKKLVCRILGLEGDYWLDTPLRMTSDGQGVIFSSTQYVFFSDLKSCGGKSIKPKSIPYESGALVDINAAKKTFLSIEIVHSSPAGYIAILGRLDGRSIDFHPSGAWAGFWKKAGREAFGIDQTNPKGRISASGRYVAAADAEYCSYYPGVWDMEKRKRVVFIEENGSVDLKKCKDLFETP